MSTRIRFPRMSLYVRREDSQEPMFAILAEAMGDELTKHLSQSPTDTKCWKDFNAHLFAPGGPWQDFHNVSDPTRIVQFTKDKLNKMVDAILVIASDTSMASRTNLHIAAAEFRNQWRVTETRAAEKKRKDNERAGILNSAKEGYGLIQDQENCPRQRLRTILNASTVTPIQGARSEEVLPIPAVVAPPQNVVSLGGSAVVANDDGTTVRGNGTGLNLTGYVRRIDGNGTGSIGGVVGMGNRTNPGAVLNASVHAAMQGFQQNPASTLLPHHAVANVNRQPETGDPLLDHESDDLINYLDGQGGLLVDCARSMRAVFNSPARKERRIKNLADMSSSDAFSPEIRARMRAEANRQAAELLEQLEQQRQYEQDIYTRMRTEANRQAAELLEQQRQYEQGM